MNTRRAPTRPGARSEWPHERQAFARFACNIDGLESSTLPSFGAAIGFAASPGGAIEWWRCTAYQHFYPIRTSNCAHDPGAAGRCARCGKVSGGFVCLDPKGHKRQHLGVDTTKARDVELLILSRAW
jgi:hypothetical protein